MYCKICGSALEDGCDFCETCGTKVKKDGVETGNESKLSESSDFTESAEGNYYRVDLADVIRHEHKPKIKKNLIPFKLIVILSLLIIFGGAGTLYVAQNVLNDDVTVITLVEPSLDCDGLYPCGEGLIAAVKYANVNSYSVKCGYINKTGEVVVPFVYDNMNMFSEGLAAVYKDGKWGYIDKTGGVVIPFIYDYAEPFKGGAARIALYDKSVGYIKTGYIDINGVIIVPVEYNSVDAYLGDSLIQVVKENAQEIININNGVVLCSFDSIGSFDDETGLALAIKDGKIGFINKNGEVVIPFIYDTVNNFSDGLAAVGVIDHSKVMLPAWYSSNFNYKWGYIDETGKLVIPMIFDVANLFHDGISVVEKYDFNNKSNPLAAYGVIDKTGEMIIPYGDYNGITDFTDGLAIVYSNDSNNKTGVVNSKGELVVPMIYDYANILGEKSKLIQVYKYGKWGIIDSKDREVVPLIYDEMGMLRSGLITVKKDGKWGILEVKK